jgi:exopolysaccharide biosynthesis operon protein EpsL
MSAAITGRKLAARRPGLRLPSPAASSLLLIVPALAAAPALAQAQTEQTAKITPFAEETVTNDDNLFRLSNQVDPTTVIGSASIGDTYRTTTVGLSADVPVSLQRFTATLTYNSYRYDRFTELDYDGYNLRGSWLWAIGRNLSGEIGVSETYSLTPFEELLGVVPDHLHAREEFAKGSWLVTPDWKLYAGADDLNQSNSDPLAQYNDVTVDSLEASLSRAGGTGNWFGLDTRVETGHFPVVEPIAVPTGTVLIDNGYKQYGAGVVVDFGADTPSHVVARADQVTRHYNQVTSRDFDRTTGRIEYTWTPDVKVSVSAIAERDISPYEYIHSSIVMVRGVTLRPLWHATDWLDVSADLAWVDRDYLSDPVVALGVTPPRDDHVHTASALLDFHPARWVTLQLSYLHEGRTSTILYGGYDVNVVWAKVRLSL